MNVLLVDGDYCCQELLKRWFKTKFQNISLQICTCPADCLEKIKNQNFEIIITAIWFGNGSQYNGLELIQELHKDLKNQCSILVFSASTIDQKIYNELRGFKVQFIQKPNIEELMNKIKELISAPISP